MKALITNALSVLCLLCSATPALAEPVTYSPEWCDFTITFPAEPTTQNKCDDDEEKKCYEEVNYTKVFEFSSNVKFRVICSPVNQAMLENYSGEVMEATLKAVTNKDVVQTYETSFREEDGYKQANLVGEGQMGITPTLFIAQLWISGNSALSIEAELLGGEDESADKAFSDILKSVSYNPKENPAPAPE